MCPYVFTAFCGLGVRTFCTLGIGQQLFQRLQDSIELVCVCPRAGSCKVTSG